MKKLNILSVFFILYLFPGCNTSVQDKQQPDFKGFGNFRINQTVTSDIDRLNYKYHRLPKSLVDLAMQHNDNPDYIGWDLLIDDVSDLMMDDFVESNMPYKHASLTFYRDTLVRFSADVNASLLEILKTRYPNYAVKKFADEMDAYTWLNRNIVARYNNFKTGGPHFVISDTVKTALIDRLAKIKKKEYLNKIGSGI